MHTVNKSYHELEKRGIIRIVPKSGAMIQPPMVITQESPQYLHINDELKPVIAEALVLGMKAEQIEELVSLVIQDLKRMSNIE